MGFFTKTKPLTYDQLLILPASAKVPAGFRPDIDIDVTSQSDDPVGRSLSPFVLGSVEVSRGLWSRTVENAWQYSKVYEEFVGADGEPNDAWYEWRRDGFDNVQAIRYPMGRRRRPEYFFLAGKKLDYVTARLQAYLPIYMRAASKTDAWRYLLHSYNEGRKILLRDFDSYDHVDAQIPLQEGVKLSDRPFGHGMVLALALTQGVLAR